MHPVTSVLLTERAPSVAALALDEQDAETVDRMPILAGHDGRLSRVGQARQAAGDGEGCEEKRKPPPEKAAAQGAGDIRSGYMGAKGQPGCRRSTSVTSCQRSGSVVQRGAGSRSARAAAARRRDQAEA